MKKDILTVDYSFVLGDPATSMCNCSGIQQTKLGVLGTFVTLDSYME